jgi:hypothetical protein
VSAIDSSVQFDDLKKPPSGGNRFVGSDRRPVLLPEPMKDVARSMSADFSKSLPAQRFGMLYWKGDGI